MGSVKVLKASAGSGKTYQLAYEYIRHIIQDPTQYQHILAVTFTNKATDEMKQRILSRINEIAQGKKSPYLNSLITDTGLSDEVIRTRAISARTKILHDYSHFAILTIDKFFQRIIRSFIKELGIDLNFNLELQTDTLLSSASEALLDEIPTDKVLKRWITTFVEEKIEENKRWDIKTELTQLGIEIFRENYQRSNSTILSKEQLQKLITEITEKVQTIKAKLKASAEQALQVMQKYGLEPSLFANGYNGVAGYIVKIAEGNISAYGKRVSDVLANQELWYAKTSKNKELIIKAIPELQPLLQSICNTYDHNIRFINSTELLKKNYRNFALLADLAREIEKICSEEGIMPISETNHILNKLVAANDTPFIFEKVGNHFSRFMIDEFQDTSSLQWENFIPLLQNALSQSDETPVLLVGDVKQSIYRWRGSDWQILAQQIHKEFDNVTTEELAINYRSLRQIVEFNNRIIKGCVNADNIYLNNELEDALQNGHIGIDCYNNLRDMLQTAYKHHEQQSKASTGKRGYVNITLYHEDPENKNSIPPVIEHIKQLQARGYAPGDIAILVRRHVEGARIAEEILSYKQQHPDSPYGFDVVTQDTLRIGNAPITSFILACFKLASTTTDTISQAIYNQWLGYAFDRELDPSEIDFLTAIRLKSPVEAFEMLLIQYRLDQTPQNIAYLQAFQEQLLAFCNSTIADIPLFVKWWEENGSRQLIYVPDEKSAITITTIHKSKGLQYKAVIIPYCDWSLSPHNQTIIWADCESSPFSKLQKVPIDYEGKMKISYFAEDYYKELVLSHIDNINTFYVATTRAMEELHLMLPYTSDKTSGRINPLIMENLRLSGSTVSLGDLQGSVHEENDDIILEFGQPVVQSPLDTPINEELLYLPYRSFNTTQRTKLHLRTQRYFEDDPVHYTLTPRDYGILMHRVFERSATREEIHASVQAMQSDGYLSSEEAELLTKRIDVAFDNTLVCSWFDGSWDIVRNESNIIIPQKEFMRRPDRVMVKGDQVVVVDYKFGLNRPASHQRQIREYMNLLQEMGYKHIEGYLWYISLDDIEPVTNFS